MMNELIDTNPASSVAGSRTGTRRLLIVLGLPLVDGVFVTLVLTGMLDSLSGIVLMGLLIFGGTATVAVILADLNRAPRSYLTDVMKIGVLIVPLAALQAMIAPSVAGLLDTEILSRFAALVLILLGLQIADLGPRSILPPPWIVIVLGLIASIQPEALNGTVVMNMDLFVRGGLAATIGIILASTVAITGARLRQVINVDKLKIGCGASLAALAVAIVSALPTAFPIIVLGVSLVLAIERQRNEIDNPPTTSVL